MRYFYIFAIGFILVFFWTGVATSPPPEPPEDYDGYTREVLAEEAPIVEELLTSETFDDFLEK